MSARSTSLPSKPLTKNHDNFSNTAPIRTTQLFHEIYEILGSPIRRKSEGLYQARKFNVQGTRACTKVKWLAKYEYPLTPQFLARPPSPRGFNLARKKEEAEKNSIPPWCIRKRGMSKSFLRWLRISGDRSYRD